MCGCTRGQRAARGGRGARLTLRAPRRCQSAGTDDDRAEVTLTINTRDREKEEFAKRHVGFERATEGADATVRRAAAPPGDRCRHTRPCVVDRSGSTRVAPPSQVEFAMASQAQDFFLAHAMCRACRGFVSARRVVRAGTVWRGAARARVAWSFSQLKRGVDIRRWGEAR